MKFIFTASFILLANFISLAQLQSYIGVNAGYGNLSMKDVNDNLDYIYNYFQDEGLRISSPEKISMGFYFDGSFTIQTDMLIVGTAINTISGSGKIDYGDPNVYYQEKYDASTIEILAMAGVKVPMTEVTSLVIKGYGGLGLADFKYLGEVRFRSPSDDVKISQDAKGTYFAGRVQGGVDFMFEPFVINVGIAYRIANSGKLKGNLIYNGETWSSREFYDINDDAMEIDYSGFIFLAGFQLYLD